MSARQPLERRVRWMIAVIVVMVLSLPVIAVRSYIATVRESKIHESPISTDERRVVIDGRSMLVQPETLERTMGEWLKSQKDKTFSFELSDRSFVAGSAIPSEVTVNRIQQVVSLSHASPDLMVHVLLPTNEGSTSALQLDKERAASFRDGLVADGVSASHVTIGMEHEGLPTAKSPHLEVLLTK